MNYFASRLSDNISIRKPEGYLICLNVPIARTGTQQYAGDECGLDTDEMVNVRREEPEVFSKATMASFEGMPVTDDHPQAEVTADNAKYLTCGHAQNIRRGEGGERDLLIADLIITDPELIRKVQEGKREVSCGYNFKLADDNGAYYQRDIRGNHIAIVDKGRAGSRVSIKDSAEAQNERSKPMKKTTKPVSPFAKMLRSFVGDASVPDDEKEAVLDEVLERQQDEAEEEKTPPAQEQKANDNDGKLDTLIAAVTALTDEVKALASVASAAPAATDVDPATPEESDPVQEIEAAIETLEELSDDLTTDGDESDPTDHEVDPQLISDEEPEDEEKKDIAKDAMSGFLKAIKPVIAALPKDQRRKAADAALAQFKQAATKGADKAQDNAPVKARDKTPDNPYLKLIQAKQHRAKDSEAQADGRELGKGIMQNRNPHYKKSKE